jgi:hypothetical protein
MQESHGAPAKDVHNSSLCIDLKKRNYVDDCPGIRAITPGDGQLTVEIIADETTGIRKLSVIVQFNSDELNPYFSPIACCNGRFARRYCVARSLGGNNS